MYKITVETIDIEAREFVNKELSGVCNNKGVDGMQGLETFYSLTMIIAIPHDVLENFPKVFVHLFDAYFLEVCIDCIAIVLLKKYTLLCVFFILLQVLYNWNCQRVHFTTTPTLIHSSFP